jgi:hypothetical protein
MSCQGVNEREILDRNIVSRAIHTCSVQQHNGKLAFLTLDPLLTNKEIDARLDAQKRFAYREISLP